MISIIDDDESLRDSMRQLLRSAGYQVATFDSAESFLEAGAINKTQCVILDLRMSGVGVLELQRRLNSLGVEVPIVFVTAHDDASGRGKATEAGAIDFLVKPFEANTLLSTIETALTRHDVHRRSAQWRGAGEATSK
ncbi:MAG: response regulator [Bryobacteraceae bacterium]